MNSVYSQSYATGTDTWSQIPYVPDVLSVISQIQPGTLALDVGCGRGKLVAAMAGRGLRAIGLDFDGNAVARATKLLEDQGLSSVAKVIEGDAMKMEFTDSSFGLVTEVCFLHHLSEDERLLVLSEVSRVTAPGGLFVSLVLSRETQKFLDFQPMMSPTGMFSKFDLDYQFFTNAQIAAEIGKFFQVVSQQTIRYATSAYGASELSFIMTVSRKTAPAASQIFA